MFKVVECSVLFWCERVIIIIIIIIIIIVI
jgi:hypothetical protein